MRIFSPLTSWTCRDVVPLTDDNRTIIGMSITFTDVTVHNRLEHELREKNRELESAYEELQSTVEELETTNEELQSTVEELETTNEELQSSNEELETTNEELQSSNDQLERLNDILGERTEALNDANAYLRSILRGLDGAVVVLDRDLTVQLWSETAEEYWGLREPEAKDADFLDLAIGLPVQQLRAIINKALDGTADHEAVVLGGHDRFGRTGEFSVRVTSLPDEGDSPVGVILVAEYMDGSGDSG
jgi:two-component system, chemotaxis family, CheB/CheR fusion protein